MPIDSQPQTADRRFYHIGGSLHADAPSYVERAADREIYDALSRGEFCYVLTSRQMGKSSLMIRTARRLEQDGVKAVVLDLTALGENQTAEQWYEGLLGLLGYRVDLEDELEDFWLAHPNVGPLRRWMMALREVVLPALGAPGGSKVNRLEGSKVERPTSSQPSNLQPLNLQPAAGRLVIFIDEIDSVRSLPFSTDEFFAAIRECYNHRTEDPEFERLTFCLLGVATPSDLIRDTRKTPFNIGRRIELNDFTEEEAVPLAWGLLGVQAFKRSGVQATDDQSSATNDILLNARTPERLNAQRILQRILYWTGGHPYLTQRLCQAVAAARSVIPSPPHPFTPSVVDRLCEELFLSTRARERDDNLIFVRERLFRSEVDRAALLDLYGQARAGKPVTAGETSPVVDVLRLSGIVRVAERHPATPYTPRPTPSLVVRNRIYARVFDRAWVTQHMPDAELRRQKAAYRRGLMRAASVGGVIVLLLTVLVLAAVSQAHRAEAATQRAEAAAVQERRLAMKLQRALDQRDTALKAEGRQRALATERARLARIAQTKEREQRLQADEARGAAVAHRRRAVAAQQEAQERLARLDVATGNRLVDEGDLLGSLPWFAEVLTLDAGKGPREAVDRMRLAAVMQQCPRLIQVLPHAGAVCDISPDGRRVLTRNGAIAWVWDTATGQPITTIQHNAKVHHAAFSPDGRRIVTTSGDWSGQHDNTNSARVWDAATGQPVTPPLKQDNWVWHAAFSPDGRRVVTAGYDPTAPARVWDAATGQPITTIQHQESYDAEFSPDGRRVVTAGGDGTARLWDAATGQPITPPLKHGNALHHAEFSPDGRRVLTASWDGTARVWDAATGQPITPPLKHSGQVNHAEFSPDGCRVITASFDGTARVWDAATGQPITLPLTADRKEAGYAEFSPDGRYVLTGARGIFAAPSGPARVWDAATGQPITPPLPGGGAHFSPDGRRIFTASSDGTVRVWELAFDPPITPPLKHSSGVTHAELSPDGRRVLTASNDGTARVWNAATSQPITPPLKHAGPVEWAEFSPEGRRVLTASGDGTARVWDAATGRPITPPLTHGRTYNGFGVHHAEFSRDGRRIVTASRDSTSRVWDAGTGRPITPPLNCGDHVWHAEFSRDGRRIVTVTDGRMARVWDADSGRPITPPRKHNGSVTGPMGVHHAAYSPDGRRIVTASLDGTARVWDPAFGHPISTIKNMYGVYCAEFSADGRRFLTTGTDGTARVWDAASGQPITPPLPGGQGARFSPDGRRFVTASADGTAQVWDLPIDPRPAADLRRLAQYLAGYRIDTRVGPVPLDPAEARREGQALRAKYPAEFAASPAQVLAWHEREASDAERAHEWAAALPHLEVLLAAHPDWFGLQARRGTAYAEMGHWAAARADFGQAIEREPEDAQLRYSQALVELAAGNVSGYQQRCAAMLDRFGRSEYLADAETLVRGCVVAPGGVSDAAPLVALAERAAAARIAGGGAPGNLAWPTTLGAALYRADQLEQAAQRLEEAAQSLPARNDPTGVLLARVWLFLAMAQARLGHATEARPCLEKAAAWMEEALQRKPWEKPLPWDERLILQHLRREAEALVQPTGPQ
jgi:WD40 repeat protein/tetratricopeptide (TPR) repeat protein